MTRPSSIDLADRIGLDTLAELWRDADPVSLPGALWALYVLRQWCRTDAEEVTRLWRAGEALAPAEAAVAGVADFADADAVRAVADAVLGRRVPRRPGCGPGTRGGVLPGRGGRPS